MRYWSRYGKTLLEYRNLYGTAIVSDLEWFATEATNIHVGYADRLDDIQKAGKEAMKKDGGK